MGAICGVPARKRLAAALLGPLSAVALLAATCGNNGEPVGSVTPFGSIAPPDGGRSLPDPARVLLTNANQDLMTGNFAAAAQAAQRARQEAGQGLHQQARQRAPEGAPQEPGEVTGCIADAVEGVADVNLNKTTVGLQLLKRGECAINAVPKDGRMELATLIYRAQAVGYARVGDDAAAEHSLNRALALAPGRANVITKELCQAARKPNSITRCVTAPKPSEPPTVAPSR
ncbi:MAG: hypothetical protein ACRDR6_15285 [Pseudonocardiaceae bacterium]